MQSDIYLYGYHGAFFIYFIFIIHYQCLCIKGPFCYMLWTRYLPLNWQVGQNEFVLKFWKRSLNPLTWTEILRQVLVAAGFGSRKGTLRREALDKVSKFGHIPF